MLSVVIRDCGLCYVGGLTTKEKTTAYLLISYFCLKTVKHVNPPAVWWFQIIFQNRERIRAEETSFLLLLTLAKISSFSFLQASNVVTHNDLDEILKSLV